MRVSLLPCVALCILHAHISAPEERQIYHFHSAVTSLLKEINTANTALYNPDAILASAMALCLHTICEGETI